MKESHRNAIIIALAAIAGGGIAYAVPLSLLETGISVTGVSGIFPAFAPPLGGTAQKLFVGASAVFCGFFSALILPWGKEYPPRKGEDEGMAMGTLFSRLTSFARGKRSVSAQDGQDPLAAPQLRRSDSHPDAPSRPPLFARQELGEEMLPPVKGPANDSGKDSGSVASRRMARIRGDNSASSAQSAHNAPLTMAVDVNDNASSAPFNGGPDAAGSDSADHGAAGAMAAPLAETDRDETVLADQVADFTDVYEASADISLAREAEAALSSHETTETGQAIEQGQPLSFSPLNQEPEDQDDIAMPRAPEPLPWHLIEEEMNRIMSGDSVAAPASPENPPVGYDRAGYGEAGGEAGEPAPQQPASPMLDSSEEALLSHEHQDDAPVMSPTSTSWPDAAVAEPLYPPVPAISDDDEADDALFIPRPAAPQEIFSSVAVEAGQSALPDIRHLVDRLEQGLARRQARLLKKQPEQETQPISAGRAPTGNAPVAFGFSMSDPGFGSGEAAAPAGDSGIGAMPPFRPLPVSEIRETHMPSAASAQGDALQQALAALRATTRAAG